MPFKAYILALLFASLASASQEGGQAEQISVFSGYAGESVWTLVWFAVLLAALKKFAWKPLLDGLKAREEHIASEISEAERSRRAAGDKLAEYERKVAEAEEEGKKIAAKHLALAQNKSTDILEAARKEAESIKARANEDIGKAVETAKKHLWDDAGEMVCSLGSEVLGRVITAQDNQKLIDEAVSKFRESRQKTA